MMTKVYKIYIITPVFSNVKKKNHLYFQQKPLKMPMMEPLLHPDFQWFLLEIQMVFLLHIRENRCYNVDYDDESIQNRPK